MISTAYFEGDMEMDHLKVAQKQLESWLHLLIKKGGTDLHIKSNSHLHARVRTEITKLSRATIEHRVVSTLIQFLTAEKYETFLETKEFDGAFKLNEQYRFRFNIYEHIDGYAITFRLIPPHIKTFRELNLPAALEKLIDLRHGLVLITGTTGSGKTSTLAAIINAINQKHRRHIITIEDPVEYIFHDERSIIEQREVGKHTQNFASALRASLREDPDIIVVGEIRDVETAESIIHAVNTGHLVFSTIHTLDAKETISRLIALFPSQDEQRIRHMIASTLEATISQRLIKSTSGNLVPAVELMFKSSLMQELILNKREDEIYDAIERSGKSYGSVTFNRALYNLTLQGKITEEQAYQYATSPTDLKVMFTMSSEYHREGF